MLFRSPPNVQHATSTDSILESTTATNALPLRYVPHTVDDPEIKSRLHTDYVGNSFEKTLEQFDNIYTEMKFRNHFVDNVNPVNSNFENKVVNNIDTIQKIGESLYVNNLEKDTQDNFTRRCEVEGRSTHDIKQRLFELKYNFPKGSLGRSKIGFDSDSSDSSDEENEQFYYDDIRHVPRTPGDSSSDSNDDMSEPDEFPKGLKDEIFSKFSSFSSSTYHQSLSDLMDLVTFFFSQVYKNESENLKIWVEELVLCLLCLETDSYINLVATLTKFVKATYRMLTGSDFIVFDLIQKAYDEYISPIIDSLSETEPIMKAATVKTEATKRLENYQFLKSLKDYKIVQSVITFLCYIVSLPFCTGLGVTMGSLGLSKFAKDMEYRVKDHDIFSISDMLVETVLTFMQNMEDYLVTKDITVFSAFNFGTYFIEVDEMSNNYIRRTQNAMLRKGQIRASVYDEKLNSLITKGKALVTECTKKRELSIYTNKAVETLKVLTALERKTRSLEANSDLRDAPYCVFLVGPPGVGKSSLTKITYNTYGAVLGIPVASANVYNKNPKDDYWDAYTSSATVTVIDEVGYRSEKKIMMDQSIDEIISIVNEAPYSLNIAFTGKGEIYFTSGLVILTGNTIDMQAKQHLKMPSALYRRVGVYVVVTIKEEFRPLDANGKTMSDSICQSRVNEWMALPENLGLYPEVQNMIVKQYVLPREPLETLQEFKILKTCKSRQEYREVMADLFLEHKRNIERAHDRNDAFQQFKCEHGVLKDECALCEDLQEIRERIDFDYKQLFDGPHDKMTRASTSISDFFLYAFVFISILSNIVHFTKMYNVLIDYYYKFIMAIARYERAAAITEMALIKYNSYLVFSADYSPAELQRKFNHSIKSILNPIYKHKNAIILTGFIAFIVYYKTVRKKKEKKKTVANDSMVASTKTDNVLADPISMTDMISKYEIPVKPLKNPYDIEVKTAYMLPKEHPGRTIPLDTLFYKVKGNMIKIMTSSNGTNRENYALCIYSQLYVTVRHAFIPGSDTMIFYDDDLNFKATDFIIKNRKATITEGEMYHISERDLVFFQLKCMPPKRSILNYLVDTPAEGGLEGFICLLNPKTSFASHRTSNIHYYVPSGLNAKDVIVNYTGRSFFSKVSEGDCGTPLLIKTVKGYCVSGIIAACFDGDKEIGYSTDVYRQDVINAKDYFLSQGHTVSATKPGKIDLGKYKLGPVHTKSRTNFADYSRATVLGTMDYPRSKPKGNITKTIISEDVFEKYGFIDYDNPFLSRGYNADKEWEDYAEVSLSKKLTPNPNVPDFLLNIARDHFLKRVSAPKKHIHCKKLTLEEAINGDPSRRNVNAIKQNTSAGFPFTGPKSAFYEDCKSEKYPHGKRLKMEEMVKLEVIMDLLRQGIRINSVLNILPKIEATPRESILAKKTRLFQSCPHLVVLLVKMYCGELFEVMLENNILFETAVGCDAMSSDWKHLADWLRDQENRKMFLNGDFSGYDLNMPFNVIRAAFDIIIALAKEAQYSHDDLLEMNTLFDDIVYHLTNVDGDLVIFEKGHGSGQPATIFINDIMNSLLMRTVYLVIFRNLTNFDEDVRGFTYGDDNIFKVSERSKAFNQVEITRIFEIFGIKYTMADKKAKVVPFIKFHECDFLKRKFIYDDEIGLWKCPIQTNSILKSLAYRDNSSICLDRDHSVSVIMNAQREYFQYGRKSFANFHKFAERLDDAYSLKEYVPSLTLYDYDEMKVKIYGGQ
jgi:hypothetical protein